MTKNVENLKIALHNLGCKVNNYEMDVMSQKIKEAGGIIVPFGEKADIYIINTCTVTNIADRKSRQMLHKAKKENPDSIVVAVGCYVAVSWGVMYGYITLDEDGNIRPADVLTRAEMTEMLLEFCASVA